jgi:hypothetical protein
MKVNIELRGGGVYSCKVTPEGGLPSSFLHVALPEGEVSHEEVLEEVKKYLASSGVFKYHVDIWAVDTTGKLWTSKNLRYEVY